MPLLNPGDPFPRLTISTTDGQTLAIPGAFAGDFGVVLLYRGAWCPYCNAQLRTFEQAGETLADAGVKVAALSVDDKGVHGRARRQALAYLPRRLRRGRARHRVAHRRVRQPRPGLPAVHRLRPRPGGEGHRRRVLKWEAPHEFGHGAVGAGLLS